MKKTLLLLGGFFCFAFASQAQSISPDVIVSAGDYFSNASGSISWSLGEPMGETYSQTNNILTQGFQQPWDFGTNITSGQTPVNADLFPNPTNDVVNIQFDNNANGVYVIEVYNTLGQVLSSSQYTASPSARTAVSLFNYSDGIYFITVRKVDSNESSTFKINKNS